MTCDRVFYERIEECLSKDRYEWGNHLLSRGTLYKKMTDLQKRQIIRDSLLCAEKQWKRWKNRIEVLGIEEFLMTKSVQIDENHKTLPDFHLTFAEYSQTPPSIQLSEWAIEQTNKEIQDNQLSKVLEEVNLRQLILAHEMYHHLEAENPEIYTNHAQIERKRFSKFRQHFRVKAASEIAAVYFSQLLTGVHYFPAIIELILVHSVDEKRAKDLADQLITEKWGMS